MRCIRVPAALYLFSSWLILALYLFSSCVLCVGQPLIADRSIDGLSGFSWKSVAKMCNGWQRHTVSATRVDVALSYTCTLNGVDSKGSTVAIPTECKVW